MRARGRVSSVVVSIAVLAVAPAAVGALPATGALDVTTPGVAGSIGGVAPGDQIGSSVAAVGDVSGDGIGDLLIGAPGAGPRGRSGAGTVHVVYGAKPFTAPSLSSPGSRGYRIDGAAAGDSAGRSVAAAGDVNGDGLGDVLVGAVGVDETATVTDVGAAYVVYGQAGSADVDLASLGTRGIRVLGANLDDQLGSAVASVGDVNGDQRGDLVVGASGADPGGRSEAGAAYVIFGPRTPANLDVGNLATTAGIRIDGPSAEATAGIRVASAGDFDGDGRPDIAIGAPFTDVSAMKTGTGSVFVVLGRMGMTTAIDLATVSATTIRIDGADTGDGIGTAFAAAGDLTGDGKGELLIGVPRADPQARRDAGEALAVRGRAGTATQAAIDLGASAEIALRVQGAADGDRLGQAIGNAADLSGDGKADLVLGAPGASTGTRPSAGAAFVVTNLATPTIDLASQASVLRVGGAESGDETGVALAAGDLSGDGSIELAVAAPSADPGSRASAGAVHVLSGDAAPAPPPAVRDPSKPDTAGVASPFVLRSGPALLIGSRTLSRKAFAKSGCLRLRVQSSAVATTSVSVEPAAKRLKARAKAVRPLALKSAPFLTPGFRPVCLKLPLPKTGTTLRVVFRVRAGTTRTSAVQIVKLTK